MHGRVKVRTTAEQEALKKKERAEKLKHYRAGISLVFQKRQDKIYDDELMSITERLLIENPDNYTLWNIRREAFIESDWTEEASEQFNQHELTLTENCLRKNPKSYFAWYQRIWIMNRMKDPDWKKELILCTKYLNYDERNFHCWDHREYVVQKAGVTPEEEFKFSTSKILSNFSNYSSWHYRSLLLSKIFQSSDEESVNRTKTEESELVLNAAFTDPSDSSAWFYQRWLLDNHDFSPVLLQALLADNNVILFINQCVSTEEKSLQINNETETIEWRSWQRAKFSKLWFGKLKKPMNEIKDVAVNIGEKVYSLDHVNHKWIYKKRKHKLCCNEDMLLEQLSKYKQLADMEPDDKWAVLTPVYLMRKIDPIKFKDDILTSLNKLPSIDPLRSNYYKDLRSKYLIEYKLHKLWNSEDQDIKLEIDLSGLDLTTLNNEYLGFFEELNLGANCLQNSLHQLSFLQNCKKLSLSSNHLESLTKFPALQNLEVLSLRNNKLNSFDELSELLKRTRLKSLDLRENPICNNSELQNDVMKINPDLDLCIE